MSKYVIDIDGVIGTKLKWSVGDSYLRLKKMFLEIGINGMIVKRINALHRRGHTIILHTSRIWHDYDITVAWLKKHRVKYDTLVMAKPLGDYYVDDHNISIKEFLDGH